MTMMVQFGSTVSGQPGLFSSKDWRKLTGFYISFQPESFEKTYLTASRWNEILSVGL